VDAILHWGVGGMAPHPDVVEDGPYRVPPDVLPGDLLGSVAPLEPLWRGLLQMGTSQGAGEVGRLLGERQRLMGESSRCWIPSAHEVPGDRPRDMQQHWKSGSSSRSSSGSPRRSGSGGDPGERTGVASGRLRRDGGAGCFNRARGLAEAPEPIELRRAPRCRRTGDFRRQSRSSIGNQSRG
jgi:hypothetical protein